MEGINGAIIKDVKRIAKSEKKEGKNGGRAK
jgi:hypothetical protein